jgi:threonine dehydratase
LNAPETNAVAPGFEAVQAAAERIAPHAHRTPVLSSTGVDRATGATLVFKCENMQRTGAFKFRGACNAVMSLDEPLLAVGVATHSSGNHAAALSLAASLRGAPATVVMPRTASRAKVDAVRAYGGRIVECEPSQKAREAMLARVLADTGAQFVAPFDDPRVIAGQGTAALELLSEHPGLDAVIAPVGGGGLLAGTVIAAAALAPGMAVYGAEPAQADDTARSFRAGERRALGSTPDTLADGLRTSVGTVTFPVIRDGAAGILTTGEETIVRAMRLIWERMKLVVEPSGAVPLAALLDNPKALAGRRVGVIVSGGNVDLDRLPWCCRREDCVRAETA